MRIGVTGAAGFIGSHVCERLLAGGHEVLGVDAFTRFYARELKEANLAGLRRAPGFELAELNLLGAPALAGALAGLDAVCHLAGRPGVRRGSPAIYEAGNVRTTEAVLVAAAARPGVRRVLLASSSSVYGRVHGRVREARARCGRSPSTGARSAAPSRWPPAGRGRSGSSWWSCATSRSTGRASARTWPSPAS